MRAVLFSVFHALKPAKYSNFVAQRNGRQITLRNRPKVKSAELHGSKENPKDLY